MTLTPDERQRIYEEEKARREAQDRLKDEKKRKGCLGCLTVIGGLIVLAIVLSVIGSLTTPSTHKTTESSAPDQPAVMSKEEVLKNIGTMTDALHDMKTELAGESMDHIKFVLEVFDGAAKLIQKSQAEQLTDEERAKVAAMRKALVARQRETFPIIRNKVGPIFSKELWMSDGKARTFGSRYTTIEFVGASFAANANIAKAEQAIVGPLTRMRFKRAQYKWYAEQDEYSYYTITSPADGDVAIIDTEGNVTSIPE